MKKFNREQVSAILAQKAIVALIEYNQWKWESACAELEDAITLYAKADSVAALEVADMQMAYYKRERDTAHESIMEGFKRLEIANAKIHELDAESGVKVFVPDIG